MEACFIYLKPSKKELIHDKMFCFSYMLDSLQIMILNYLDEITSYLWQKSMYMLIWKVAYYQIFKISIQIFRYKQNNKTNAYNYNTIY